MVPSPDDAEYRVNSYGRRVRRMPGSIKLGKSSLAAGCATMGVMLYAVVHMARPREGETQRDDDGSGAEAVPREGSMTGGSKAKGSAFLASSGVYGGMQVSASNVPSYVLATSGLDNEQKLQVRGARACERFGARKGGRHRALARLACSQVALCRRQSWVRAFQLGPALALWSYAACVLTDAAVPKRLPRYARWVGPLGGGVFGMALGAYYGGVEAKPMMNAALLARPVEHAHKPRSQRPPEEDAMVHFIRAARDESPRRTQG